MINYIKIIFKNILFGNNIILPKSFFKKKEKINFFDVGASFLDQNINFLKYEFFNLILFEPDNKVYASYCTDSNNLKVYNLGLWSKNKKKKIYFVKNQIASSVYKPNIKILERYNFDINDYNIIGSKDFLLKKLDQFYQFNQNIDFIKVDTEGADYDVLIGAKKSLKSTLGLQVEVQNIERYINSKKIDSILKITKENNLEIFINNKEMWPRSNIFNIETNFQNVWSDIVFFKDIEYMLNCLKKKKYDSRLFCIKKLIFLMLQYKLHDSAINYINNFYKFKLINIKTYNYFLNIIKKNVESNFSIILKDLLRLSFILVIFPLSLINFKIYLKLVIRLIIKNINNLKRFFQNFISKNIFRNGAVN